MFSSQSSTNQLDKAVTKLIVKSMLPLSIVDSPDFKSFVNEIVRWSKKQQPLTPVKFVNRQKLTEVILKKVSDFQFEVHHVIKSLDFYCLTFDGWSAYQKNYGGMTLHFIDSQDDFKRKSMILALRRFKGEHGHRQVRDFILEIMRSYKLPISKCVGIVTDNARNYVSAFEVGFVAQFAWN